MVFVERALGAVVQDRTVVQEHAGWRHVVAVSVTLACRDAGAAEHDPCRVRLRHDQCQLLHKRIATDHHQDLRRPIGVLFRDSSDGRSATLADGRSDWPTVGLAQPSV